MDLTVGLHLQLFSFRGGGEGIIVVSDIDCINLRSTSLRDWGVPTVSKNEFIYTVVVLVLLS